LEVDDCTTEMLEKVISEHTVKHHYIEPQGTGVNGSIYSRFEISHIHFFALVVAGPFTVVW